ncbi:MAG TPA: HAMP domain-containing sensor histidine kinase [Acidimicrobiales bacterium]|nr:HAMP domain-containing sensor histidine kinase [Acidimicrobiales bacterium]
MTTHGDSGMPAAGADRAAELERALADVDAVRRRVVNVVGHVLRTPTTTIAGMAAALQATDDETTRLELIRGIARNAARLEELLDELLIASGVNTALPVVDETRVALRPAIQRAWESVGGRGPLDIDGPDVDAVVRPPALAKILSTLLDNALRYGHGRVGVRLTTIPSGVRIEIESTNDGPTDEELTHAFELLYRGEHAVMTAPGLGLGLTVARELARSDGGDVRLERSDGDIVAVVDLPA